MFTRPSMKDTEEDLLKYQEEFFRNKPEPSVKIVKKKRDVDECSGDNMTGNEDSPVQPERDVVNLSDVPLSGPPLKKSRFKAGREAKSKKSEDKDPEEMLDEHDDHITKVLADIVEREFKDGAPVYYPTASAIGGFPKVLHRGDIQECEQGGRKRSLFAQQFAKSSAKAFGLPEDATRRCIPTTTGKAVNDTVIERQMEVETETSDADVDIEKVEIHKENKAKLDSMSEAEILVEQRKLLQTLDPDIVTFLKHRSKSRGKHNLDDGSEHTKKKKVPTATNKVDEPATKMVQDGVPKPSSDWIHMDRIETEKLEWMKDLPAPSADDKSTGKAARFNLQGELVAMDADLPTHLGLHHHGDEPERAGYSLGELFHLARSAHMQQRTVAINTLAKVIRNARQGHFHGSVSTVLIPAMVEGGLVFILRWALDDKTDNTMAAAVNALHALLVTQQDEDGLDLVFTWYRGHESSHLQPPAPAADKEDPEDKPSDAELLKQDLIKGLLQMSLLPRLRYILEVWKPGSIVVLHILDLIIRIARHSMSSAYEVMKCPRLIETIFKEFLQWKIPDSWPEPLISVYGLPCPRALKLVRVICTASRNLTGSLISSYPIMDSILLYISQAQQKRWKLHEESHQLLLESFRMWRVCIMYGYSVTHYHECYTMLVELLQSICTLSSKTDHNVTQLACTVISFLESVVHTAAKCTIQGMKQTQDKASATSEMKHMETNYIPELNWGHVTGLHEPILLCMTNTLDSLRTCYVDDKPDLSLAASCLNFIASWLSRLPNMPNYNAVGTLGHVEQLAAKYLKPMIESQAFTNLLTGIRKYSVIIVQEGDMKEIVNVVNLPDLGGLVGDQSKLCPILDKRSTSQFILGFVRVLDAMKLHKGVSEKLYPMLLNHPELIQYLRQLCLTKKSPRSNNFFAQFENRLQQLLVSMTSCGEFTNDVALYHQVALMLLTRIHEGSELDIHHLLSSVLFNNNLLSDLNKTGDPKIAAALDTKLQLEEIPKITSITGEDISVDETFLLGDIISNLMSIRNAYLAAFGGFEKSLQKSTDRSESSCSFPDSLMLGACGEVIVPVDWVFLPLVDIYNKLTTIGDKQRREAAISASSVAIVTNCLRYVHCIEAYRPGILDSVTYTIKLSRLMCTFLAGSDLFLDKYVQVYLRALLQLYCKPAALDRMDFTKPVPGLASFYDFYIMVLDQFSAESFGDWLFSCYVILPLQQMHSLLFRKAVWGEYKPALQCLYMKVNQVGMPINRFLEPEESNLELLRLYYEALFSGQITPSRTPFPYLIAVHHVNRFFYNQQDKHRKLANSMMKYAFESKNETLRKHLVYYKMVNREKSNGLEMYDKLPVNRQAMVDKLTS